MTLPCRHEAAARGFTLLEVLVVLIVVSLISVVLMQGLGAVLNLRDSYGRQLVEMEKSLLNRSLVLHPLQGMVPDFSDGEDIFAGTSTSVSGLTIQPLSRRPGRPTPIAMELTYDPAQRLNTLVYKELEDEPIELLSWEGDEAAFKFIGDENGWQDKWPPERPAIVPSNVITEIGPPQIPELIFLDTKSPQELEFAVTSKVRRNRVARDPIFAESSN